MTMIIYDKKCLFADEMVSFHQEASDCVAVCWQLIWTDLISVFYTDTVVHLIFKFLVEL